MTDEIEKCEHMKTWEAIKQFKRVEPDAFFLAHNDEAGRYVLVAYSVEHETYVTFDLEQLKDMFEAAK